jgi:large subunit ribosomal protein L24e
MVKCSYCETEIAKGTGKLYVYITGKFAHLCSSKCEKNMLKLKRKARKLKWVTKEKKVKGAK